MSGGRCPESASVSHPRPSGNTGPTALPGAVRLLLPALLTKARAELAARGPDQAARDLGPALLELVAADERAAVSDFLLTLSVIMWNHRPGGYAGPAAGIASHSTAGSMSGSMSTHFQDDIQPAAAGRELP